MSSTKDKVPILGSERALMPGSRPIGPPDPNERIEITILLRRPSSKDILTKIEQNTLRLPKDRQHLTREEFRANFGAVKEDIEKIETFARENGLDVVEKNVARCTVTLSGTIASLCDAFGVKLTQYEHPSGTYRGRTGPVHVPDNLSPIIQAVFGFDNRPQASPHFRHLNAKHKAVSTSYTPNQLANLYDFPGGIDGSGECIAIIELGGGYNATDLKSYFTKLGIKNPNVSAISVDGSKNQPTGSPDGPDGEVMLDIEVVGAVAPGAQIVVYFAPNTDRGFLDAIDSAIHDTVNKPSVISISWGGPESNWTTQSLKSFDQAFQNASALGITVCVAAGDNGSSDGVSDHLAHVDFPASSPYVLACGGTRVNSSNNKIVSEVVWNDLPTGGATGGGISDFFDLPSWQAAANVPPSANPGGRIGRGVPDVAGDADPVTGYSVLVDGQSTVIGGTSAVAPLYAALTAIINQSIGKSAGYLNPLLYNKSKACKDITNGNNGAYKAKVGWDACTGLGRINGLSLLNALKSN